MNQKLKTRVQTAVIFGAIMVLGIGLNVYTALALMFTVFLGCTYEYARITHRRGSGYFWATVLACCVGFALPWLMRSAMSQHMLQILAIVFSLAAIINLYTRKSILVHENKSPVVGLLYIGLPMGLLCRYLWIEQPYQASFLFTIFAFIWMSDSAAYLVGSRIGKTKLFPSVSPNKTWEGSGGALVFNLLLAFAVHAWVGQFGLEVYLGMAALIWAFGTYGDLVESSIKRQYDIKDSGSFMPGHGGFLDRFDSFIFVLPVVLFLLSQMIR